MNLKWKAQKGIWNPVSNDLPLEDSGDQDYPKWLGSPEGGRRVSELVGVPKGKIKSPERGQWSDGRGSIPRREKPPPRIPNPPGWVGLGKKWNNSVTQQEIAEQQNASKYRVIFYDRYLLVQNITESNFGF